MMNREKIANVLAAILPENDTEWMDEDLDLPLDVAGLSAQVQVLRKKIMEYEKKKYPARLYTYHREVAKVDGVKKDIIHVHYLGGDPTEEESLETINAGIIVRKLNLISTVLYALDKLPSCFVMTNAKKAALEKQLFAMVSDITDPGKALERGKNLTPAEEMDDFISQMITTINESLEPSVDHNEILRKIRNAERYFVAQNNKQRILVYESEINEQSLFQVDIPFGNKLSRDQKIEFTKIHRANADQPSWFKQLPEWEKVWFRQNVPQAIDGDWTEFESLFQSSAMQHIPGLKNARYNHLVSIKDDEVTVLSKNFKTGTMVPYEMPLSFDELVDATKKTARQALGALRESVQENFEQVWGKMEGLKPLILVQSLLSDTTMGGSDNTLTKAQQRAIESIKHEFVDVHIVTGNEPENFLRLFARQDAKRWEYADQVIAYAHHFKEAIAGKDLTPEQIKRVLMIELALAELEKLTELISFTTPSDIITWRNYEAFKVAYISLLTEAMGGMVSTNCKSGKDRTGLDEIYRHAMTVYFEQYHELPSFSDSGENRQRFIDIFVALFNTMKSHEAAAANTPGSFGLKDDAKMLCKDISEALGSAYTLSNKRAAINKPPLFTADEAKQTKARSEAIKEARKEKNAEPPRLWTKKKGITNAQMKKNREARKKRAATTVVGYFLTGDLSGIEELAATYAVKAEYAAKRGELTEQTKAELNVAIEDCIRLKARLDAILTDVYTKNLPNNPKYRMNVNKAKEIKQKLDETIAEYSNPLGEIITICNGKVCETGEIQKNIANILNGESYSNANITSNTEALQSTQIYSDKARVGSISLKDERPLHSKPFQVAVVQQFKPDGAFVTELHFKDDDMKRMGAKGSRKTGAKLIEEHLANPKCKFPIEINGNFPKNIVKDMILYCKVNNYDVVNNTQYKYQPNEGKIAEAKKKFESEKMRAEIFGERAKQLGKRDTINAEQVALKLPKVSSQQTT